MPELYSSYRTFISSPSDVSAERQFAEEAIQGINRTCFDTLKASIDIRKWEHMPPEAPHLPEEQIQDMINKEVEKAHFFVLILYKRYGRIEHGYTKSNTERELETILKRYETNPQLRILAYFRDIPANCDPGEQEAKVKEFRHRLECLQIRYRTYKHPDEFKDAFTHDMYNVLMRMCLSPFKQNVLRHFWRIGEPNRPTHPRLAILIPAVSREFMSPEKWKETWLYRLQPNVYFEDYKATHKVKKLLSLIGFNDYKTYFVQDPPGDLRFMNRVWICFPRSRVALKSLEPYSDQLRFNFSLRKGMSSEMKWKSKDGNIIQIKSLLPHYLKEQRTGMDVTGEWTGQLSKIYCKDFAVIARFRNEESANITEEGYLYEYYFAGIRGLGTWGAAWYIDRKSKALLNYPEDENLQRLLEVTYSNGGIVDVVDVSDESEEYFHEQNQLKFIREQIRVNKEM